MLWWKWDLLLGLPLKSEETLPKVAILQLWSWGERGSRRWGIEREIFYHHTFRRSMWKIKKKIIFRVIGFSVCLLHISCLCSCAITRLLRFMKLNRRMCFSETHISFFTKWYLLNLNIICLGCYSSNVSIWNDLLVSKYKFQMMLNYLFFIVFSLSITCELSIERQMNKLYMNKAFTHH